MSLCSLCSVSGCTSGGCTSCREFVISCATGDGTFGWLNAAYVYVLSAGSFEITSFWDNFFFPLRTPLFLPPEFQPPSPLFVLANGFRFTAITFKSATSIPIPLPSFWVGKWLSLHRAPIIFCHMNFNSPPVFSVGKRLSLHRDPINFCHMSSKFAPLFFCWQMAFASARSH